MSRDKMDEKYFDDYFAKKSVKVLGLGAILNDDPHVINLIAVFKEIFNAGAAEQFGKCMEAMPKFVFEAEGDSFSEGINKGLSMALAAIQSSAIKGEKI
jgi:hypothetical protein